MAPSGRKEKVSDKGDIKKSSYYVWFLGAKESKGLRGEEYILPVVKWDNTILIKAQKMKSYFFLNAFSVAPSEPLFSVAISSNGLNFIKKRAKSGRFFSKKAGKKRAKKTGTFCFL